MGGRGRGVNQGYRGRGGGRGGFQPGRPTGGKKETLKFEGEYDFDKANEEFKEVLEKLQKSSLESKSNGETAEPETNNEIEEGEIEIKDEQDEEYYDKKKSFFDSISCEATEKAKGRSSKPDWRAEKKLNRETFGVSGNNRRGYYRRGGQNGGQRGGYNNQGYNNQGYNNQRGYNNQQEGYNNQQGYSGFNSRFARDGNNMRGGGRGRGRGWGRGQRQEAN